MRVVSWGCSVFGLILLIGNLGIEAAETWPSPSSDSPQMNLPRHTLRLGRYRLKVQLATTEAQRQKGLMFRKILPSDEGMLFVFEQPRVQCFWMKNTLIPLDALFLDEAGHLVNIASMEPLSELSHCSQAPVRFVLETSPGWAKRVGFDTAQHLQGLQSFPIVKPISALAP
jgi:uncharacterized membrane protein (UPF0127 family)